MAALSPDKTRTLYADYEDYVTSQEARAHDYDCPKCFAMNMETLERIIKVGLPLRSLLDIGCRDFSWSDMLTAQGVLCRGIDISRKSVDYAKSRGRHVVWGDAVNLDQHFVAGTFDLVLSSHSFEHFLEPDAVLRQAWTVLAPGGHILIRCPIQEQLTGPNATSHVRTWSRVELIDAIQQAGFTLLVYENSGRSEHLVVGRK